MLSAWIHPEQSAASHTKAEHENYSLRAIPTMRRLHDTTKQSASESGSDHRPPLPGRFSKPQTAQNCLLDETPLNKKNIYTAEGRGRRQSMLGNPPLFSTLWRCEKTVQRTRDPMHDAHEQTSSSPRWWCSTTKHTNGDSLENHPTTTTQSAYMAPPCCPSTPSGTRCGIVCPLVSI